LGNPTQMTLRMRTPYRFLALAVVVATGTPGDTFAVIERDMEDMLLPVEAQNTRAVEGTLVGLETITQDALLVVQAATWSPRNQRVAVVKNK